MAERLTVPDRLLLAALRLRERKKTFSAEDLVVEAWTMFPDTFGLSGYSDKYPDSNRILTKIMGTQGMRGKSWLRKTGTKQYSLTAKALADGQDLLESGADSAGEQTVFLRGQLHRTIVAKLNRLVGTPAARKALGEASGDYTFTDACGFWDITARSNANTLNAKLADVGTALEQAQAAVLSNAGTDGLQLPSRALTLDDLGALKELHKDLQETFDAELQVLRKRTDERLGSRRPG